MRYVLSIDTIRDALETLTATKSHEQIVLYLAILRLRVRDGNDFSSGDVYSVIRPWLDVPGKEGYPYYRPFASRGTQFWMNGNLAGSYAPSSLRGSRDLFYSSDSSSNQSILRLSSADDIAIALKIKTKISLWAIACYFLRNSSFVASKKDCHVSDVLDYAKSYFGINETEFADLFDFELPETADNALELADETDEAAEGVELVLENESYRRLNATELGIVLPAKERGGDSSLGVPVVSLGIKEISTGDEILIQIIEALNAYSGAILSGAPGTSKSYYARRAAEVITGQEDRVSYVQFHPSYQFEDFVQGYRPCDNGAGFEKRDGIFLEICKKASCDNDGAPYVLVIDELSRGDSQRIFGEALTYIEKSKRGMEFTLPSGDKMSIPDNLYLIATMNPVDRGADDVDLAFGRRFGTIQMDPSPEMLRNRLTEAECPPNVMGGTIEWFIACNKICSNLELPGLGHAFFWEVNDLDSLERSWRLQIKPHLHRLLRFEKDELTDLVSRFERLLASLESE